MAHRRPLGRQHRSHHRVPHRHGDVASKLHIEDAQRRRLQSGPPRRQQSWRRARGRARRHASHGGVAGGNDTLLGGVSSLDLRDLHSAGLLALDGAIGELGAGTRAGGLLVSYHALLEGRQQG